MFREERSSFSSIKNILWHFKRFCPMREKDDGWLCNLLGNIVVKEGSYGPSVRELLILRLNSFSLFNRFS